MPKRKKTIREFAEDIGFFEVDDIKVTDTGRILEETKRFDLDFPLYLAKKAVSRAMIIIVILQ